MMSSEPSAQLRYLAWSISHVVDILGWHQNAVLRRHGLEPVHMSLLLRADRHGPVDFGDVRRHTSLPTYSVSRAAYWLEDHELGTVRFVKSDRRRRRFRINQQGKNLVQSVEFETAKAVLIDIGAVWEDGEVYEGSRRYYEFTRYLWNLTTFLPNAGSANVGCYVPTQVPQRASVSPAANRQFQEMYEALTATPTDRVDQS